MSGKILNPVALNDALTSLNKHFEKKDYSSMELRLIIEEYRKTLRVFEKLSQAKALRKTMTVMEESKEV